MCYSIEPRDRRYVKSYVLLAFAKNISKNLSNKYGQKLVSSAKKSATDALKIARKRAIRKIADLVGNFIADKITNIFKKSASEPHSNAVSNEIPKERYISPQERQKNIDELRLI